MAFCIRTKLKKYKDRTYRYFELVNTYRDPNNKKRVISEFKCHLGSSQEQVKAKLERYKHEAAGHYNMERLIKMAEKEISKGNFDTSIEL